MILSFPLATFGLGDMTLTLEILKKTLWHLLYPKYWFCVDQFEYVNYPLEIGVHGRSFCPREPWPWRYDLNLGNHLATAVFNILMLHWLVWVCGLHMRIGIHRYAILPPRPWTLILEIMWHLLCWCRVSLFLYVDYPWGVGAYGHVISASCTLPPPLPGALEL